MEFESKSRWSPRERQLDDDDFNDYIEIKQDTIEGWSELGSCQRVTEERKGEFQKVSVNHRQSHDAGRALKPKDNRCMSRPDQ